MPRIAKSALVFLLALAPAAKADEAPAEARIRGVIEFLSSPGFAGRSIGTPEAAATAGYLAGALAEAGIAPAGDAGYFTHVPIVASRGHGAMGALTLGGQAAALGRDFTVSSGMDAPVSLTAPLAVVRWSSATVALPEDLPLDALDGAILVEERLGSPLDAVGDTTAAALSKLNDVDMVALLSATPELTDMLGEEAAIASSDADPSWHFAFAGEKSSVIGGKIDAGFLDNWVGSPPDPASLATAQITLLPGPAVLDLSFDTFERRAFDELNVIARLPGHNPEAAAVLLTAHYDHLGVAEGVLYPGADDNLSGVSTIIEVARQLAADPPAGDVEIVFFTGEEHGLIGSRAFAQALPRPVEDYAALFNIDAIGRALSDLPDHAGTIYASGVGCFPQVDRAVAAGVEASGLEVVELADEPTLAMLDASCEAMIAGTAGPPSDQLPLLAAGLPGVLLVGGINADYHQPGDTADKVDYVRLARVAEFLVAAVRDLGED